MALGKNLFLQFAPMASWITQKKTVSKSIKKWRNQYNSVSCLFTFCLLLKIPNTLMETTLETQGIMPSLVPIGTLQTFAVASWRGRCFQVLFRFCADSVKKFYFSASAHTYLSVAVHVWSQCSRQSAQQLSTVSQQRTSEVAARRSRCQPNASV